MTESQFETIVDLLREIKKLLEQQSQPQTKITVVGNKPQTNSVPKAKGFNASEDFSF